MQVKQECAGGGSEPEEIGLQEQTEGIKKKPEKLEFRHRKHIIICCVEALRYKHYFYKTQKNVICFQRKSKDLKNVSE